MAIDYRAIEEYTKLQSAYVHEWLMMYSDAPVRLYNMKLNELVQNPELFRRGNDWRAAAYMQSVALDQGSGDDCIDAKGNFYELKLAFVDSDKIHFGPSGTALLHGAGNTSFNQAFNAKYRVHKSTAANHHKKETAFVLMSKQHHCYITGFMMTGEKVNQVLTEGEQTAVDRSVSLSQFIRNGYEIKSTVPYIGWERYYTALTNYVKARERKITGKEARDAITTWVSLANPDNLSRLKK